MIAIEPISSSFRDPAGFVFWHKNELLRQINQQARADFDLFLSSGLYADLTAANLLIAHEEVSSHVVSSNNVYKVIKPQLIPFVSYPYEWSFSQLKDAALVTLAVQKAALKRGMILKDASAFNIQFYKGRPIFIDTLSFKHYQQGVPWVAYRQFCQHFLGPLALMSSVDARYGGLSKLYIDGLPLDLVSRTLPLSTHLSWSKLIHVHLHAKSQEKFSSGDKFVGRSPSKLKVSRTGMLGLIDSLENAVRSCVWQPVGTEWGEYYNDTNYSQVAFEKKADHIRQLLQLVDPQPHLAIDFGGNTGHFSRLLSQGGTYVVSADVDHAAVEKNYLEMRRHQETNILPLFLDLTNPSPGLGWANDERPGILHRHKFDLIMSLALIHHLVISNNVPLQKLADFYQKLCPWLIIEFVPKADSQVQRLLQSRSDIFTDYDEQNFEKIFGCHFEQVRKIKIDESQRTLYLFRRRFNPTSTLA